MRSVWNLFKGMVIVFLLIVALVIVADIAKGL